MQNKCSDTLGDVRLVSIRVLDRKLAEKINNILSKFDNFILARLGLPKSKCDSLILVVCRNVEEINDLVKELSSLKDIKVKDLEV